MIRSVLDAALWIQLKHEQQQDKEYIGIGGIVDVSGLFHSDILGMCIVHEKKHALISKR